MSLIDRRKTTISKEKKKVVCFLEGAVISKIILLFKKN
jgi:hypothetical protein